MCKTIQPSYLPSDQKCNAGKVTERLLWSDKSQRQLLKLACALLLLLLLPEKSQKAGAREFWVWGAASADLPGDLGDGVYGEPGERLHADPSPILTLLGWDLGSFKGHFKFNLYTTSTCVYCLRMWVEWWYGVVPLFHRWCFQSQPQDAQAHDVAQPQHPPAHLCHYHV